MNFENKQKKNQKQKKNEKKELFAMILCEKLPAEILDNFLDEYENGDERLEKLMELIQEHCSKSEIESIFDTLNN